MVMAASNSRLEAIASKLKRDLTATANGPLLLAADVVELIDNWAAFKEEAEGLSCAAWLRKHAGRGRGPGWFRRRMEAVKVIGNHAKRVWDHDAAVWLASQKTDELTLRRILSDVEKDRREHNGDIPTVAVVRRIAAKHLGKPTPPKANACERCQLLETLLREHGLDVPK